MFKTISTLINACLALNLTSGQQVNREQKYPSPDKAVIAVITSRKVPEATDESRVELISKSGKLLAKHDYFSEDGEHGFGVTKAEWTPDSKFFVYSLESSGGHQAWHSQVCYFSRKSQRILILDDELKDGVMNPKFKIEDPNTVVVELWFSKRVVDVSLSSMRVEQK